MTLLTAEQALETQRVGALQIRVALLCALAQAFDGYDIAAISMAAPALAEAWHVPATSFAEAFVLSSVGILVGALSGGPIGDRLGRKPVLIANLLLIGAFSLASAFAQSLATLSLLRFVTGVGIGGVMPNTVALTSDYAPQRYRATFVTFMFCGNTAGSFLGGQLVARMLPQLGWQSIFVVGGLAPILLVPALLLWLPESARFLLARARSSRRAQRLFARLGIAPAAAQAAAVDVARGNPVAELFAEGFALRSVLLWVMFFANLLDLYLLSYWMPSVLHLAGLSPADSVFAASMLTGGGLLSILAIGFLSQRFGGATVLTLSFASGSLFIAAIALLPLNYGALLAAILGAGVATVGSQLAANGLVAALYPARIRATGVGWALGVGRLGGIAGPGLGGVLLGLGWPPTRIFLCAAAGALVAAAATVALGLHARRNHA